MSQMRPAAGVESCKQDSLLCCEILEFNKSSTCVKQQPAECYSGNELSGAGGELYTFYPDKQRRLPDTGRNGKKNVR